MRIYYHRSRVVHPLPLLWALGCEYVCTSFAFSRAGHDQHRRGRWPKECVPVLTGEQEEAPSPPRSDKATVHVVYYHYYSYYRHHRRPTTPTLLQVQGELCGDH